MRQGKPVLYSCVFLLCAVIALFLPALSGKQGIFHDDLETEQFTRSFFLARNFQQGRIPLWDPQSWCGGIPFYGRYYSDTYYLPMWPAYLLTDLKSPDQAYRSLILLPLFLHYLLAALGMFFFLRKIPGCGCAAASLGALAYLYSPAFSYSYVWQPVIYVQAWLPWLLLLYISVMERMRYWKISLAALVASFIISSGAPNWWPFAGIAWAGIAVYLIALNPGGLKGYTRFFIPLGIASFIAGLGAALSAAYLFGFIDARPFTSEHIPLSAAAAIADTYGSLPPPYLATLFSPDLFGNVTGKLFPILSPAGTVFYWEANLSAGVAVTFLVLLGSALVFNRRLLQPENRRLRYAFILAGSLYLCSLLLSLGRFTPFYEWTMGLVPGAGALPRPIRYRMLQCFASAILVCGSLGFLAVESREKFFLHLRRWVWLYAFISACVLSFAFFIPAAERGRFIYPWLGEQGRASFYSQGRSLFDILFMGGAAARHLAHSLFYWLAAISLLITGVSSAFLRRRFAWIVGFLLAAESFVFGSLAFYGSNYSFDRPSLNHLRFKDPAQSPFVQRALALEHALPDKTMRVSSTLAFQDNFLRLTGLSALAGYEMHPLETRFKLALESAFGQKVDYPMYYRRFFPLPEHREFLDNFSVGYVLSEQKQALFKGREAIVPLAGTSGAYLHYNPGVLPRAYIAEKLVVASDEEQLRQLISVNLGKNALIDAAQSRDPQLAAALSRTEAPGGNPGGGPIPAKKISLDDPNALEIELESGIGGMLVVTEIWFPGWKAFVDGKESRIYRVNYCQRGVWVEKGNHKVVMRFIPQSWHPGLAVSLAGLLVTCGLFFIRKNR